MPVLRDCCALTGNRSPDFLCLESLPKSICTPFYRPVPPMEPHDSVVFGLPSPFDFYVRYPKFPVAALRRRASVSVIDLRLSVRFL